MKKLKHILVLTVTLSFILSAMYCKEDSNTGQAKSEEEKGKEIYTNNGCWACHGDSGKGDGPSSGTFNPKPRNFSNAENFSQGSSLEQIAESIKTGVPESFMVGYPHLNIEDRILLARYITSFRK